MRVAAKNKYSKSESIKGLLTAQCTSVGVSFGVAYPGGSILREACHCWKSRCFLPRPLPWCLGVARTSWQRMRTLRDKARCSPGCPRPVWNSRRALVRKSPEAVDDKGTLNGGKTRPGVVKAFWMLWRNLQKALPTRTN